nr:hypothetical protein [Tanacetum cinerariifolium]
MCDKKNSVLFTDTECLVLSPDFKLPDENHVLLRVPKENNMYNVNLKNIVPFRDLTCLFAKATIDNLTYGIEGWNICVACKKGKQHRASCKTKPVSSVDQPLYRLHMDLFGPTFVKILNKKRYCLVITDDYSRFTWVFFLATKDETSPILKTFITGLENQLSLKVKVIRSDNGTEFKNNDLNQFYRLKGIKREFNSLLPIPFWAEAVNTACYVQNRVLVTKPHNKTPYELLHGKTPSIGFMRPFGCLVTILNTLDSLGKFDGKVNEGFLVGYSNNDGDATFDGKEHDAKKPESEVNVSPSSKFEDCSDNSINEVNAAGTIVPTVGQNSLNSTNTFSAAGPSNAAASPTYGKSSFIDASQLLDDPDMPELEDITYSDDEDDVGAEAGFNNLETSILVSLILTSRIHKDHHEEPKRVNQALKDPSWIEVMQEELLQFKMQKVWILVDLPHGKELLEEGIDYEEVFGPVARIEAIRLFLAYAFFMGFMVFEDPDHPDKVYKVVKALYGLHQAPRPCDSPLLGVNTPRSDEDRLELIELMVFLLPNVEKVGIGVNAIDLQIIDFLNGSSIKYALTVNPNIYVSYIKQFWTTVPVKQVNDITRLQALVDKKKVVVTEAMIREAIHLDDAEGVDCLPNEEIFVELARMGYEKPSTKLTFYKAFFSSQWKFLIHTILQCMSAKRTSWNEFSSSMASAIICLSSGDLSTHTTKYTSPSLTQKVFANMRRVSKGFSGVETPLFEGMLVEQQGDEEGDADENVGEVNAGDAAEGDDSAAHGEVPTVTEEPSIPSPTPTTPPPQPPQDIPSTSQLKRRVKKLERRNKLRVLKLRRLQKVGTSQRVETSDDTVMDDESNQGRMIVEAQVPGATTTTLTAAHVRVVATPSRRRKRVVTRDPEEESTTSTIIIAQTKSKDKNIDWDESIDHVKLKAKEDPAMKKYPAMKRKPQTEAQTRKNMMMYLKNVVGFKMDYFKGIQKEEIEEDENRALQKINETPSERVAKRRKLDKEVEELKRHIQIVPNEDDDVYTEATPLARKLTLLVERKYPLTRFTLYQMLNAVRLEVEEESEVSLKLLRFIRQQHQEGQLE